MAVFVRVSDGRAVPGEHEVADARAQSDGDAQPHVEGHEDEHEEVTDDDLDDVEHGLEQVGRAEHRVPGTGSTSTILLFQA